MVVVCEDRSVSKWRSAAISPLHHTERHVCWKSWMVAQAMLWTFGGSIPSCVANFFFVFILLCVPKELGLFLILSCFAVRENSEAFLRKLVKINNNNKQWN